MSTDDRVTEPLRQCQQQYEALVSSIGGIVWEADARTLRFLCVSQKAERLLGYPLAQWLDEPAFWADHIYPDDRESAVAHRVKATKERHHQDFEYRMLAANGSLVWMRDIVTALVENDQPVKLCGVMVDITQVKRTEERVATQYAVMQVLAEAPAAGEVTPEVLKAICEGMRWELGELWRVDAAENVLRWETCWHTPSIDVPEFLQAGRLLPMAPDRGLAGQVWSSEEPIWMTDVTQNAHFMRVPSARQAGLHAGFGFPIRSGNTISAVMTFFSFDTRPADNVLLQILDVLGRQIGEFIERRRAEERFSTAFNASPSPMAVVRLRDLTFVDINESNLKALGFTKEEVLGRTAAQIGIVHQEEIKRLVEMLQEQGAVRDVEVTVRTKSGETRVMLLSVAGIELGGEDCALSAAVDITERKKADILRAGQSRVLEMIATSEPLEETLATLMRVIESQSVGMLCSIVFLDEDGLHLRHGAAPSLPEVYTKAIDGASIGPQAGSCGTAMYLGKPVIVTDILEDPLWAGYHDLAAPHGLRACWSTPVFSHQGKVLGSFAMYYREVRSPSPVETRLIDIATHIAGIAIERKRAEEGLLASEKRFAIAFHSSPVPLSINTLDDGRFLAVNEHFLRETGYVSEEVIGHTSVDLNMWPGPEQRLTAMQALKKQGSLRNLESTFPRKHGELRDVLFSLEMIELEGRECVLLAANDITERKRAEEQIKSSLREKEVMLRELHHRVKNNLQIVSSLLNLQSHHVKDRSALEVLRESKNRITSMAMIHDTLYRSKDWAQLDWGAYVHGLVGDLFRSYGVSGLIRAVIDVDEVQLPIEAAIPCGLIINELVSNALKHAFAPGQSGEIRISLRADGNRELVLLVSDNGIGFPDDLDFHQPESLGLQLVNTLTTQLKGSIELERVQGSRFKITFAVRERGGRTGV